MLLKHGLAGLTAVAGATGITRLLAAERISTGSNKTSYNSTTDGGGTFTAQTGTNRLFVILVTGYTPGVYPTGVSVSYGAQSATLLSETLVGASNAISGNGGIFYIKDADIPSGANDVTVTYTGGGSPDAAMRSCTVFVAEYENVDQTTPFGTPSTASAQAFSQSTSVTIGTSGSALLSISGQRTDSGGSTLPSSTNRGTIVLTDETGLSAAEDHACTFVEELNLSTGAATITHTYQISDPGNIHAVEMFAA